MERILSVRKRESLTAHPLYLITDRTRFGETQSGEEAFLDHVAACLDGGVRLVQYREPRIVSDRKVLALSQTLRALTHEFGARLILAERVDVARAVQADGVHLGPEDLEVQASRRVLGHEFIIGLSVHTQAQAEWARTQEVDYLTAGPVFASEMVPGQPPVGMKLLQWMQAECPFPWFAAGGIDFTSVTTLLEQQINRVALTRCLMAARSPKEETAAMIRQLSASGEASLPTKSSPH
jgi:thiamine-phosphate pyrophosphorylase